MSQYAEIADIVHARCTGERDDEEWVLEDPRVQWAIENGDWMAWIVAVAMSVCASLGMPERFSRMNRRGAPDTWKIGALVLTAFLDKSEGGGMKELSGMTRVLALGGLTAAPDESTLRKFCDRLPESLLDDIIAETFRACGGMDHTIAIDGTGFSDSNASPHYCKRILQMKEEKPAEEDSVDDGKSPEITYGCTQVRGFEKATLAGSTSTLVICICDVVSDHSADVRRMLPVARAMADYHIKPDAILADKGYDAEHVHKELRQLLECDVIIPARESEPAKLSRPNEPCTRGFFRRIMRTAWGSFADRYRDRALIECINSMLKRLFGGRVSSRREDLRHMEVKLACIGHNILRMADLRAVRRPMRAQFRGSGCRVRSCHRGRIHFRPPPPLRFIYPLDLVLIGNSHGQHEEGA